MSAHTHVTRSGTRALARAPLPPLRAANDPEVSFVFPCLNEAATVAACVGAARRVIADLGLSAEVVVADNGSDDGSPDLARRAGARVVEVAPRGYGSAIRAGVRAARGRYAVVADADGTYDLAESVPMIVALRAGADLVVGSRFRGRIMPGAMPWKNRHIGNPALTAMARTLFRIPISDFHCGLRAVSTERFNELDLRAAGMEFATEMIVKAAFANHRIEEVAVTLHPDARGRAPHLRPWADGWRHARLMLFMAPAWTLILPGLALTVLGLIAGALLCALAEWREHPLGLAGLVGACLATLVGFQAFSVGIGARAQLTRRRPSLGAHVSGRIVGAATLERALLAALLLVLLGSIELTLALLGLGGTAADQQAMMRHAVAGVTCVALAGQTMSMALFLGTLAGRAAAPRAVNSSDPVSDH